jgi:hypothetical protein
MADDAGSAGNPANKDILESAGIPFHPPRGAGHAPSLVPTELTMTVHSSEKPHHLLSDDQLESFQDLANDRSFDFFSLWLGTFLGLLPGALQSANKWLNKVEVGPLDAILVLVCVGTAVAAVLKFLEYKKNHPKLEKRINEIRARQKIVVRNGEIQQTSQGNGDKKP